MHHNLYGDSLSHNGSGFGVDIASQRADDLDKLAIAHIEAHPKPVRALDLACGQGGQAIRMAAAGAEVIASDVVDFGPAIASQAAHADVAVQFIQQDMRGLQGKLSALTPFNVIVCQRAIHYLPHQQAQILAYHLYDMLAPGGFLFISASGLRSELGEGYPHASKTIENRYAPLSRAMEEKHGIKGPVCLFEVVDLALLLEAVGFVVSRAFASPFGNVKVIAQRVW